MKFLIPALLSFAFAVPALAAEGDGSLPPNPVAGQCYIHKFYPPTYETTVQPVVVKEAYKTFILIPAIFKKEQLRVKSRDAFDSFSIVSPTFEKIPEKIQTFPPDATWRVDCCPHWKEKGYDSKKSCEQACFKAHTPQFITINKEIVKTQGAANPQSVPEEFVTIDFNRLVTPASTRVIDTPAVTMNVTIKKLTSPGTMKWEEGTCGKYTCDPKDLKAALKLKGYYAGPMTPEITPDVVTAMNKFRADNNLGQHDALDKETALALGIQGYVKN